MTKLNHFQLATPNIRRTQAGSRTVLLYDRELTSVTMSVRSGVTHMRTVKLPLSVLPSGLTESASSSVLLMSQSGITGLLLSKMLDVQVITIEHFTILPIYNCEGFLEDFFNFRKLTNQSQ